jgi:hypothetical protein
MNPKDAAAHLLRKIMRGMIPQTAKQQGMPMEAEYQQIALGSLYAVHNGLYLVPFNKLTRHGTPSRRAACRASACSFW